MSETVFLAFECVTGSGLIVSVLAFRLPDLIVVAIVELLSLAVDRRFSMHGLKVGVMIIVLRMVPCFVFLFTRVLQAIEKGAQLGLG